MTPSAEALRAAIMGLAAERGPGRSFCPSEPARRLGGDWRALMSAVRTEAARLQQEGVLTASQRGRPVKVDEARGPIRLQLAGPDCPPAQGA